MNPVHPSSKILGYRYWIDFVYNSEKLGIISNAQGKPALVVDRLIENADLFEAGMKFKLHSFGYNCKKAKTIGWQEHDYPIYLLDKKQLPFFVLLLRDLTGFTEYIVRTLQDCFNIAYNNKTHQQFDFINKIFWVDFMHEFFENVDSLHRSFLENSSLRKKKVICNLWFRFLRHKAIHIFEVYIESSDIINENPKAFATSKNILSKKLRAARVYKNV